MDDKGQGTTIAFIGKVCVCDPRPDTNEVDDGWCRSTAEFIRVGVSWVSSVGGGRRSLDLDPLMNALDCRKEELMLPK
jgi:hypothetical protein